MPYQGIRALRSARSLQPHLNSRFMGLTRAFKCAVDASAPNSQVTRDVSDLFALPKEAKRILSLRPSSGLPTLVLPLRLCFGDALPLPFEHHLALELGHRGKQWQ